MSRQFFLLLFLLQCLCLAAGAATFAARRVPGDDGLVVAWPYAGRVQHHPLGLAVQWPGAGTAADPPAADIRVPAGDALWTQVAAAPDTEDSPLDDPWIQLRGLEGARARTEWRLGQTAMTGVPATRARARGYWNAGWPNATVWARYAALVYTGAHLEWWPRGTDQEHDLWGRAAAAGATPLTLPAAGVRVRLGAREVASNVTLVWDPSVVLTTVPPAVRIALLTEASAAAEVTLVLADGTALLLTDDPVADLPSAMPAATAANEVRIGRRLMASRALAVAWAAAGATYVVAWASPLPDAARYTATALAAVLAFFLGYLATSVLHVLRLVAPPMAPQDDESRARARAGATSKQDDESIVPARAYRHAALALLVGAAAHGLAVGYMGRGPVIDLALAVPLRAAAWALLAGTLPLFMFLLLEAALAVAAPARAHEPLLFAHAHQGVVTRGFAAALGVAAATSEFTLLVWTLLVVPLVVLLPSVYAALVLAVRVGGGDGRSRRSVRWLGHAGVAAAVAVLNLVMYLLWVLPPFLAAVNTLYAPWVLRGVVVWAAVILLLAPALLLVRHIQAAASAAAAATPQHHD